MKKTVTLFSALLIFSSTFPITSFAEEINQEIAIESNKPIDVPEETSTSGSATQESSSQPETSTTQESVQESQTPDGTESSNETIPSEVPVQVEPTETPQEAPAEEVQEVIPEAPVVNEAVITVEPSALHFDKDATTEGFIARIGEPARKIGQETNLFASVMIAQAILESGSGGSSLSQEPYNNLFGIKGEFEGQSVTLPTLEDDGSGNYYSTNAAFRVYPGPEESIRDYSKLFTDGVDWNPTIYKGAWKSEAGTYQNATQALTGVYATDTLYNQKLNGLIETYNLTQYDYEKGEIVAGGDFEPYNNVNYDEDNRYVPLNCTQYAYNRITQLGGYVDLDMGNGADWGATGVARGYEVSNTPKAGTAVSFAPGVLGADSIYGHVAFCEKVNEDGSILISEMNAVGLGVVSTRTILAEYTNLMSYISPK